MVVGLDLNTDSDIRVLHRSARAALLPLCTSDWVCLLPSFVTDIETIVSSLADGQCLGEAHLWFVRSVVPSAPSVLSAFSLSIVLTPSTAVIPSTLAVAAPPSLPALSSCLILPPPACLLVSGQAPSPTSSLVLSASVPLPSCTLSSDSHLSGSLVSVPSMQGCVSACVLPRHVAHPYLGCLCFVAQGCCCSTPNFAAKPRLSCHRHCCCCCCCS